MTTEEIARGMVAVARKNGTTLRELTYYMLDGALKEAVKKVWEGESVLRDRR